MRAAANDTQISQLTGRVEALNAVLGLARGETEEFRAALDSQGRAAGNAAAAADIIGKTISAQATRLSGSFENFAETLGNAISQTGIIQGGLQALTKTLEALDVTVRITVNLNT